MAPVGKPAGVWHWCAPAQKTSARAKTLPLGTPIFLGMTTLHTWWIFHVKDAAGADIALVEAPDHESAIREAIRKYEIKDPERQKRLVALRQD